jgi:polyhydroxybutyrate depolymerase
MPQPRLLFASLPAALLLACSSGGGTQDAGGSGAASTSSSTGSATTGMGGAGPAVDAGPIGGDRPVNMFVPVSYQPGTPVPLVMMLHGYSATAVLEELYLDITAQAVKRGFIYAYPDGTKDATGLEFWNATDACCNLYGSTVDDSAYLSAVITEIQAQYSIDPKQIYLVGHSNGAFMSYRMACDHADQIAAFVSLAGAMWEDTTKCTPSQPVSMLEIHGTADTVIPYIGGVIDSYTADGGLVPHTFPGVTTSVADWVTFDGCGTTPDTTSPPLDLDSVLLGDETTVTKYAGGCKPGGHAELWTIVGGAHVPNLSQAFTPDVIQFLYDHPRP